MKPKPLIGKIWKAKEVHNVDIGKEGNDIEVFLVEDVKSACEFYMRYKDKPTLLKKEHPKIEVPEAFFDIGVFGKDTGYNDWLFKFTFKSVFM